MATKKEDPEVLDLTLALSDWEKTADPKLREALTKALNKTLDLSVASDEELGQIDTASKSRQLYSVSLVRLLSYLRTASESPADNEAKAKLSMAYIKHAESGGLSTQLLGRGVTDDKLVEEIAKARDTLRQIAEEKSRLMTDGNNSVN